MPRSFGLVDNKVQETEYFLDRILSSGFNIYGLKFDMVAFAGAARSITFAMQSSLTGIPEFDKWYAEKQEYLGSQPLCSFFNRLRRVTQHIGESPIGGGHSSGGEIVHYFAEFKELGNIPEPNVALACEQFYKLLLELVYECYLEFNPHINGQWRFTEEHFQSLGLTIEDAEEEIGLPRGWSAVSGFSEEIRWKYLRKEVDGCNVQPQFERWLGKELPIQTTRYKSLTRRCCRTIFPPLRGYKIAAKLSVIWHQQKHPAMTAYSSNRMLYHYSKGI